MTEEHVQDPFDEILEDMGEDGGGAQEEKMGIVTPDEDRELLERHGLLNHPYYEEGFGRFHKMWNDHAQRLKAAEEMREFQLSKDNYAHEKMQYAIKKRYKEDLNEAFGSMDDLSDLMSDVENLTMEEGNLESAKERKRIHKIMRNVPKSKVREMIQNLLDRDVISEEQAQHLEWEFLNK